MTRWRNATCAVKRSHFLVVVKNALQRKAEKKRNRDRSSAKLNKELKKKKAEGSRASRAD